MNLQKIKSLYKKYKTPRHVQQHMKVVAKIAIRIGRKLQKRGITVDLEFVHHLALLHDFLKMLVFKERKRNDPQIWKMLRKKYPRLHDTEVAAIILKKIKEDRLADSIRTQQFDAIIATSHSLKTWEEKIVYFADKRVAHEKIVTLQERLQEGKKRYSVKPIERKKITRIRRKMYELQKTLCTAARKSPESLII